MMGQMMGQAPPGQNPWANPGPALQPWEVPQQQRSRLGLVIAAVVALLIAAGITFAVLKLGAN